MPAKRFAEVFQASADWPGTAAQQEAVETTLHLEYGSLRWRLVKRLDQTTNQIYLRSALLIGFPPDDMFPVNMLAVAGITGINFRAGFAPGAIARQLPHEVGHVVDKHLLTQTGRVWFMHQISGPDLGDNHWNWSYQETFADRFADWFISDGVVRPELTPILLPD